MTTIFSIIRLYCLFIKHSITLFSTNMFCTLQLNYAKYNIITISLIIPDCYNKNYTYILGLIDLSGEQEIRHLIPAKFSFHHWNVYCVVKDS